MARRLGRHDDVGRALQQRLDRHVGIGGDRDEGGIGAVLQQAADEIGEEVAVAADRRIGAAGRARMVLDQASVERLAHAVQALELVALDAAARAR